MLKGQSRPVDLLVDCVGEVVVNNVHIGIGAQASRKATKWKKWLGRMGYVVGAAIAAVKPPFLRLRITVDGEVVADFEQRILMAAVGNGPTVGGGARITPYADPEDGRVDVMISFAAGPLARVGYAARFRRGEHQERADVRYLRASTVSVSGQGFYCSADGEVYGPERNRTWWVRPAAYSMILPD